MLGAACGPQHQQLSNSLDFRGGLSDNVRTTFSITPHGSSNEFVLQKREHRTTRTSPRGGPRCDRVPQSVCNQPVS